MYLFTQFQEAFLARNTKYTNILESLKEDKCISATNLSLLSLTLSSGNPYGLHLGSTSKEKRQGLIFTPMQSCLVNGSYHMLKAMSGGWRGWASSVWFYLISPKTILVIMQTLIIYHRIPRTAKTGQVI